ncbi:MAG: Gfo/Idh/MocA family oxidoreductase [Planctomycetes bacterium]|nr:Gfo/Idh/MocA family oxidoreductase [Planctomycetota bacterium]
MQREHLRGGRQGIGVELSRPAIANCDRKTVDRKMEDRKTMDQRSVGFGRREFLIRSAAAVMAPLVIPSGVLAWLGRPGANERLTLGHIGVGGMGGAHLDVSLALRKLDSVNIAAVCEADSNRLAAAAKKVGEGCRTYSNYRDLLEQPDIDAVVIATPDHWHAVQAVHACQARKHVYVEKPASCTVAEGRAMVAAARQNNCVVQVGSQARSAEPAHQVCTYIRNGMLGKVHTVTCWHTENPSGGPTQESPPPPELDWDAWLGPLSWRPYIPGAYHPGNFRWMMESGGGVIRDRGAHVMSVILWCLDADQQTPATIEATGDPRPKGVWDCPPKMKVVYQFKDPDWQLIWEQPGDVRGEGGFGMVFHGEQDTLAVSRDGTRIPAADRVRNFQPPAGGVEVYRMAKHADYNMNHKEDWLQAVKEVRNPCMDIDVAHRVANLCNLGNLSYILGRKLTWDGRAEQFVGDDEAQRMLARPEREKYRI